MYSRALWKFYLNINLFNMPFTLAFMFASGFYRATIFFATIGILVGYLGINAFKKNELYGYYNVGFTIKKLLLKVWLLNIFTSLIAFMVYSTFKR